MILPITAKTNTATSTPAVSKTNGMPSASIAASAALEGTSKMFYNNYYHQSSNGFSVQNLLNNNAGQAQFDTSAIMASNMQQQGDAWPHSSSPSTAYEYRNQFTKLFQQNNLFLNQGHMMGSTGADTLVDSQQFHNPYLLNGDVKPSLVNNENSYLLQQQQNDYYQHNGK
jgi:hypothetical protein